MLHILVLIAGGFIALYLLSCIILLIVSYKAFIKEFKEQGKEFKWFMWVECFFSNPAIFIAVILENYKNSRKDKR